MRDSASMRFLHSVIAIHQWPLPLARTSYAHIITRIKPHTQYRQGGHPCSHILWLVLRVPENYDTANLLAKPTCHPRGAP